MFRIPKRATMIAATISMAVLVEKRKGINGFISEDIAPIRLVWHYQIIFRNHQFCDSMATNGFQ
jgi:hypothetical protein